MVAEDLKWLASMAYLELFVPAAEHEGHDYSGDLAVMLTGGGARAAYQVGMLKGLAAAFPDLQFQIVTGVSAGAINAAFLAAAAGTLASRAERLERLWRELECRHVFRPNFAALLPFRTMLKMISPRVRCGTFSRTAAGPRPSAGA